MVKGIRIAYSELLSRCMPRSGCSVISMVQVSELGIVETVYVPALILPPATVTKSSPVMNVVG